MLLRSIRLALKNQKSELTDSFWKNLEKIGRLKEKSTK